MATKEESAHMDAVASLGCVLCGSPATIHHCGTGAGGRRRQRGAASGHFRVIPLCPFHHQGKEGVDGKERGMNKKLWQEKYGSETYWLGVVADRLRRRAAASNIFFTVTEE